VSHVPRFTAFAVVLAAAAASNAAAPERLSDAQFIAANRCLGLMQSKALATPDGRTLASIIKAQGWSRPAIILDQADEVRDDAQRLGNHPGDEARSRLVRERDGACQAYLPAASVATTPAKSATP
jgi:uncharacterized protein YfiM (DUF2279 family)